MYCWACLLWSPPVFDMFGWAAEIICYNNVKDEKSHFPLPPAAIWA